MAYINGNEVLFGANVNVKTSNITIVQEAGNNENVVMSQKAVSNSFANALKGYQSGEVIALDDTSPIDHEIGVKVRKKNLIPYPYTNFPNNIDLFADNGDGTVTINGTISTISSFQLVDFTIPAGTYTISGGVDNSHGVSIRLYDVKTGANIAHSIATSIKTFTVTEPTAVRCAVYCKQGETYDNFKIYPMIEEGTKETSYAPFITEDVSTVKVLECGKNILDVANTPMYGNHHNINTKSCKWERTETGIKVNVVEDMTFPSLRIGYKVCPIDMVKGKTITVSFNRTGVLAVNSPYCMLLGADTELIDNYTYIGMSLENDVKYAECKLTDLINNYAQITATIPSNENRKYLYLVFYIAYGSTAPAGEVIEYSNIQVEINDTATEYAPYVAPKEYAVDADGTAQGIVGKGETITLYTDTAGAVIDCTYNRDINKAFAELQQAFISLGGNV